MSPKSGKPLASSRTPSTDVDGYLKKLERFSELGVEMINTGPVPGTPDPAGFVKRFGDEVMPKLSEIG